MDPFYLQGLEIVKPEDFPPPTPLAPAPSTGRIGAASPLLIPSVAGAPEGDRPGKSQHFVPDYRELGDVSGLDSHHLAPSVASVGWLHGESESEHWEEGVLLQ